MTPPTLVATPGAANANTYITLEEAEVYFASRPNPWTATEGADDEDAVDDSKRAALLYATLLLDREKWKGTKGSTTSTALTQALAWPRRWAPTLEFDSAPDFVTDVFIDLSTAYYDSTTIPTPIKRATCELALELLRGGTTDVLAFDGTRNIKSERIGPIATDYFDPSYRVRGLGYFPTVIALVAHLLRAGDTASIERV